MKKMRAIALFFMCIFTAVQNNTVIQENLAKEYKLDRFLTKPKTIPLRIK